MTQLRMFIVVGHRAPYSVRCLDTHHGVPHCAGKYIQVYWPGDEYSTQYNRDRCFDTEQAATADAALRVDGWLERMAVLAAKNKESLGV